MHRGLSGFESLCAGNCDEDRGLCYCAGLATPFQRSLPIFCQPWAHRDTKLPDGRPGYPLEDVDGKWGLAPLVFEKDEKKPWVREWARYYLKPFDWLYGDIHGNPVMPQRGRFRTLSQLSAKHGGAPEIGYCDAAAALAPRQRRSGSNASHVVIECGGGNSCYEGTSGRFCENPKRAYCLRDCMGRGRCDSGFCWCERGWFGVDCSQHRRRTPRSIQQSQRRPSRAASSPLRVYVYDMPAEFTTRNLQWRTGYVQGLHRVYDEHNRSRSASGSLYAMESALHEWMLDSPLRTHDPHEAHLFFVPVYAASLFMWPIVKYADEPYLGRDANENRRRSHQGALLLKSALQYVRRYYPFWNASGGADHVWMMLHDEGPCFAPRELRSSILLTHYGYHEEPARPWGTFYDDNFLADKRFYRRHLGAPEKPTRCFAPGRDLVIPPWKAPNFWTETFSRLPYSAAAKEAARARRGLVFFAGDLGLRRLKGYSHDLRQRAYSMFCNPSTTKMGDCTPFVYGCRKEFPLNCSRWEPGVKIATHTPTYHEDLREHTFCLAFPGDGWSSRVLDGIVHGCIPVVVQDHSEMFFEGAFAAAGLGLDYADFSIRLPEAELPQLVTRLRAVPAERVVQLRRLCLWLRDYFVYKDMPNPYAARPAPSRAYARVHTPSPTPRPPIPLPPPGSTASAAPTCSPREGRSRTPSCCSPSRSRRVPARSDGSRPTTSGGGEGGSCWEQRSWPPFSQDRTRS